ncbi:MAG: hypothetical protein ACSLFI_11025 [Solirubrobacterales bacterium]
MPASSAPQGPWVLPASDLSAPGGDSIEPQIAIGPDGTVTAIWTRSNGTHSIAQVSTMPPGGDFSKPLNVSPSGEDALEPQIVTAPDGTTSAVWNRFNGTESIVQAVTRPPGGTFGPPIDLSAGGQTASQAQVTAASDSTITVVWQRYTGIGVNSAIQASTRPPGGAFAPAVNVSSTTDRAFRPQVTTARDGSVTVVWLGPGEDGNVLRASTRPAGGSFSLPANLSKDEYNVTAINYQVSTGPNRTTTVAWALFDEDVNTSVIQASVRLPGGTTFGDPVDVSANGAAAFDPQIASEPNGDTTLIWRRSGIIQSSIRLAGKAWSEPRDLSAAGQNASNPQISTAADSTTTSVWRRSNGTDYIIQSSTKRPGGNFGPTVDISAIGQDASDPQVESSQDATGAVTAIWTRFDGANEIVQSASTTRVSRAANFTRLALLPKSKRVKAGKKLKMTVKVTNSGILTGTASVRIKSSAKKKLTTPTQVKLKVPGGTTTSKTLMVKAKSRAKGKVTVTAKLGGKSARSKINLKR